MNLIRTCVGTSSLESTKRKYEVSNFDQFKLMLCSASEIQDVFPVGSKPHRDYVIMMNGSTKKEFILHASTS